MYKCLLLIYTTRRKYTLHQELTYTSPTYETPAVMNEEFCNHLHLSASVYEENISKTLPSIRMKLGRWLYGLSRMTCFEFELNLFIYVATVVITATILPVSH